VAISPPPDRVTAEDSGPIPGPPVCKEDGVQKNTKPPIRPQPEKDKPPTIIKGTIEPTTKK